MPRPSRLTIAKADILKHFRESRKRTYTESEISAALTEHRDFWRLAQSTTTSAFISFLTDQGDLREITLRSDAYGKEVTRYTWGEASIYEVALSVKKNGYLSHGTAVQLHGLTDLLPKMIYLNVEQSPKPMHRGSLTQASLDRAFTGRQRQSQLTYAFEDWSVTVLSGKNTGRLGVENITGPRSEQLASTNLERTLIDIVVRPSYAGGIFQVLETYRRAKSKVSVNRLVATLKKLDYVYPYHQSIGFLMQRAGYDEARYSLLDKLGIRFDFYLVHGMRETEYDTKWRLHFPKGL